MKNILILSCILFASFALLLPNKTKAVENLSGKIICLDPGHGGSDPGAINTAYNLKESEINLDVSFGLKQLLVSDGATVVLTRETDVHPDGPDASWSNNDRYSYCNVQAADLLVSVHTNSVSDPTWDGSLVLYGPKKSPELAQAINEIMFPYLRDTRPSTMPKAEFVDYGLDRFASGVLFKSDMAAAMAEPLFMSNPAEAQLLIVPIFDPQTGAFNSAGCSDYSCRRGQISKVIYGGILNYWGLTAGSALPPTIRLDNPADGSIFNSGEVINFSATAADIQDGDLTESIVWTSNLSGEIGIGGSIDSALSEGTHLITAEVTNSAGQTNSANMTILIEAGNGGGISLNVQAYKMKGNNYAKLNWQGTSEDMDIKRDGLLIYSTSNVLEYIDGPLGKGPASATYQVCEKDSSNCSNIAQANW